MSWKNSAECNVKYRITQGRGKVFDEKFTLTMCLTGKQMEALYAALSSPGNEDKREVFSLLDASLLSAERIKIEKGEPND